MVAISHLPLAVSDTRPTNQTDTDQAPALQEQFPSTSATVSSIPQEELDLDPKQLLLLDQPRPAEEGELSD